MTNRKHLAMCRIIKKIAAVAFIMAMTFSLPLTAQENVITLYGKVTDCTSGEALFFSSVNLEGTRISNISNSEGIFSFKVPSTSPEDASIVVSHLGYLSKTLKISDFNKASSENPLAIALFPVSLNLNPSVVRSVDAKSLFQSAFYRVKYNYPQEKLGMTAFYREMIKKGANRYLVLNEAVLDIDKAPYSGYSLDKVGIYKGRGTINYESSDTLFVKLQGGVNTALNLDVVKNPFIGTTVIDAERFYDFSVEGVSTIDTRSFFMLGFKTKADVEDILFKGRMYIESESLAIARIEFEMDLEGREEEASRFFIVKSSPKMRYEVTKAEYIINYKEFEGLWYYDYCCVDVDFVARKQHSLFRRNFSIKEEMVMTDHKSGGIAIEPASRLKFKDILSDRIADYEDDGFWEDYNIIEPDKSIDDIVKRIIRQLNRRQHKASSTP